MYEFMVMEIRAFESLIIRFMHVVLELVLKTFSI